MIYNNKQNQRKIQMKIKLKVYKNTQISQYNDNENYNTNKSNI